MKQLKAGLAKHLDGPWRSYYNAFHSLILEYMGIVIQYYDNSAHPLHHWGFVTWLRERKGVKAKGRNKSIQEALGDAYDEWKNLVMQSDKYMKWVEKEEKKATTTAGSAPPLFLPYEPYEPYESSSPLFL